MELWKFGALACVYMLRRSQRTEIVLFPVRKPCWRRKDAATTMLNKNHSTEPV